MQDTGRAMITDTTECVISKAQRHALLQRSVLSPSKAEHDTAHVRSTQPRALVFTCGSTRVCSAVAICSVSHRESVAEMAQKPGLLALHLV